MVAMISTPGQGYWLVGGDGGIFSYGDARFYGSTTDLHLQRPVSGAVRTPSGAGYWLVAEDGGVFTFGDARFYGSRGGSGDERRYTAIAATPSGRGYWIVREDGRVFEYGDAVHFDDRRTHQDHPMIGIAPTSSGNGYWLAATDGGVFTFGDASWHGSRGSHQDNRDMIGIAATPSGRGYWMVGEDGGVFAFGDATFGHWGLGGTTIPRDIVGFATRSDGQGMWMTDTAGTVYAFGTAQHRGGPGVNAPPPPAGNQPMPEEGLRERIVSVAESQLGYVPPVENCSSYGNCPAAEAAPWAAFFASWVWNEAGGVALRHGAAEAWLPHFEQIERLRPPDAVPELGDVLIFANDIHHLAIVTRVDGSTIHTIEGNTRDDLVRRRSWPLGDPKIDGIASPTDIRDAADVLLRPADNHIDPGINPGPWDGLPPADGGGEEPPEEPGEEPDEDVGEEPDEDVGEDADPEPGDTTARPMAFDGDPATTQRIDQHDPVSAAVGVSQLRFDREGRAPDHVVLSRDDVFADSLAGAPLTAGGPLLLTASDELSPVTAGELERVLPAGGVVYVLGGANAIASEVEADLEQRGYTVMRLDGPTRVETALAVADQIRRLHPSVTTLALARAEGTPEDPTAGWADSVTGGGWAAATGVPIVVTPTEELHPAVRQWIEGDGTQSTVLFGGTAALAESVEQLLPRPRRVGGVERADTAVVIADQLWALPDQPHRRVVLVNGFLPDGWAYGLAAAGIASDEDAPILLARNSGIPPATEGLLRACDEARIDLLIVGAESIMGEQVHARADELDGAPC